ncbi:MAG: hypothetical protein JRN62_03150 [Nitrososphaerota archaeon]|jgi:hypothetical protein|nr:hypothetical protein [Nitrososphaerota archaeon]MDG6948594.1 hypothetical protein [Nitrososphaerota archaeon]
MGWGYKYVLMPQGIDIEALRKAATAAGFQDMTDLAEASRKWEDALDEYVRSAKQDAKDHKYTDGELRAKSKAFQVRLAAEPADPDLKKYRKAEREQDLGLYQVWFSKAAGRQLMFYTAFGYDTSNDFLTVALGHLCMLGFKGKVWVVEGDSVTDTVSCAEYDLEDGNIFTMKPLRNTSSGEGEYKDFLSSYKETGADLKAIHDALMEVGPGKGLPTVMLGRYLPGETDKDRWNELIQPVMSMNTGTAKKVSGRQTS